MRARKNKIIEDVEPSTAPPTLEELFAAQNHTKNVIDAHRINYAVQNENATCDKTANKMMTEQQQQKFIRNIMSEGNNAVRALVLWHGLGSGKTLTSILTTVENNRNIVVFSPASLIGNYKEEIENAIKHGLLEKPSIQNYREYFQENTTKPQCGFSEYVPQTQPPPPRTQSRRSYTQKGGTLKKRAYTKAEKAAANAMLMFLKPPRATRSATARLTRAEKSAAKIIQKIRPEQILPPPPEIDLTKNDVVLHIVNKNKNACDKPKGTEPTKEKNIKFPKNKTYKSRDGKLHINTYYFYSNNGDLNEIHLHEYKYYFRQNSFLIFDESQLFISKIYNAVIKDTKSSFQHFYERYIRYFHQLNLRALFLSGTPIVDTPAELAILFNMLRGDGTLFDVKNFHRTYTMENMPRPYVYSYSNTQREEQLHHILHTARIKREEDFKRRIYGTISYFGNIKSLLPSIILTPDVLRRSFPEVLPENIKYGYNNDGQPLFFIKECAMTSTQYIRMRVLQILIDLLNTERNVDGNTEKKVKNEYLYTFKSIFYEFGMIIDINIGGTDFAAYLYQLIAENINLTAEEILNSHENKYKTIRDALPQIKRQFTLTQPTEFIKTNIEREEDVREFFTNNFKDFLRLVSGIEADVFARDDDLTLLRDYSCKIYEICRHIQQNSDKKHIIYCESRRVNVVLARALRAYCNMTEYMGDNTSSSASARNMYMFLTGSGKDDPNSIYFNNEGKLRVGSVEKEQMIKYFNEPNNDVKVVILNSAAAEGITLKGVNFVHILEIPPNMSRLYQIIGRAIRNCTHIDYTDKTVVPILYIATHPAGVSESFPNRNIENYVDIVNRNDAFLPYLKLLKQTSLDCLLTKEIAGNEDLTCYLPPLRGGGRRTKKKS